MIVYLLIYLFIYLLPLFSCLFIHASNQLSLVWRREWKINKSNQKGRVWPQIFSCMTTMFCLQEIAGLFADLSPTTSYRQLPRDVVSHVTMRLTPIIVHRENYNYSDVTNHCLQVASGAVSCKMQKQNCYKSHLDASTSWHSAWLVTARHTTCHAVIMMAWGDDHYGTTITAVGCLVVYHKMARGYLLGGTGLSLFGDMPTNPRYLSQ